MTSGTRFEVRIDNRPVAIQLPDATRSVRLPSPPLELPLRDAVRAALESPLEFPNVSAAILEDDTVAIAIEDGVPEFVEIAIEITRWLLEQSQAPREIRIVLGSTCQNRLDEMQRAIQAHPDFAFDPPRVLVVQHQPNLQDRLEYIAAAQSADPIYVTRDLVEAAFVLPVYCIRHEDAPNASDRYAISPMFADAQTQKRWYEAWFADNRQHKHQQMRLSREAGWLMGVQYAIAIVPAEGGRVGQLLGGDPTSVYRRAKETWRERFAPNQDEESRYDLIIASIDGPRDQQSWMNIARAAWQCDQKLSPAGRIVLCADIDRVTDGIAQLASDEPDEELQQQLLASEFEDAFAATILRSIQAKRSIYLFSRVDEGHVESLGFAFISDVADIERLAHASHAVAWLGAAQF